MKKRTDKEIEKEANKRYGEMSFGNDRNVFIEGAKWYRKEMTHFFPGR